MADKVTDNQDKSRFEMKEQGLIAFANYRREGDRLVLLHVESPPELRGAGVAGRLMVGILDHARARHQKVIAVCPYAADFIRKHPQYQDLLP